MIELAPHSEGLVLSVKAEPGSRASAVRGEWNGMLKVAVTQVAEKGKANTAVLELLSEALQVKKRQIELLSGDSQSRKRFLIREVSSAELIDRLQSLGVQATASDSRE